MVIKVGQTDALEDMINIDNDKVDNDKGQPWSPKQGDRRNNINSDVSAKQPLLNIDNETYSRVSTVRLSNVEGFQ